MRGFNGAVPDDAAVPPLVAAATERAREAGFPMSSEPGVGRLLAVLAAHLPQNARVLELGTGAGVGTAWITAGLGAREDVTVVSVEKDAGYAALAARGDWPPFVDLRTGDALEELAAGRNGFDLIFADAPGGKTTGLERTIAALRPHGLLVVDDMTELPDWPATHKAAQEKVRQALMTHPGLVATELATGSGVILATARE